MRPQPTDQLDDVDFEAVTLAYEVDIFKAPHDFLIVEVDTVVKDYYETWTSYFIEWHINGRFRYKSTDHATRTHEVEQTVTKDAVHLMYFILNFKGTSSS